MLKSAMSLIVVFAALAAFKSSSASETPAGHSAAGFSSSSSGFAFCATAGDSIVVRVVDAEGVELPASDRRAALLSESGEPIRSFTNSWRAPYTGVYFGRVAAGAAPRMGEAKLSVAVNGQAAVLDPADLSVTQNGAPDTAIPGDLVTFAIGMHNAGPTIAQDASMLDPLPVGTSFASLSIDPPDGNWDCTVPAAGTTGKIFCSNKCFQSRGSVVFTITATVNVCVGDGVMTNTATVASLNPDPNDSDNSALVGVVVTDSGACDDGVACTEGDRCAPGIASAENFDGVTVPLLPPGWVATMLIGPTRAGWAVRDGDYDTPPSSAFARDAAEVRDAVLDSPSVFIVSEAAQLRFMNRYDLEFGADGGVLEIRIGDSGFIDILAAGGQFESGGYFPDLTIRSDQHSPIGGRMAWTGDSRGFRATIVRLPATAVGNFVVFRWRLATDQSLGKLGQWIDSVVVTGPDVCSPGTINPCDDGNPCTEDACEAERVCVYTNNTAVCDDSDMCTRTDFCVAGTCIGSNPPTCADADICTVNACDPASGCVAPTANLDMTGFSAGRVDGRDLAILAHAWNTCPADESYDHTANLDIRSPCINEDDFHLFMGTFGSACTP